MLDVVEDKQGFAPPAGDARRAGLLDPQPDLRRARSGAASRWRVDDFEFLRRHTDRPIKVTLPGPYLLTRAMWVKEVSRAFYPTKEDLGEDVVRVLREEVLELKEAGVAFIQLDEPVLTELVFTQGNTRTFMCAALAARKDPAEELAFAVSLINRVVEPISTMGPDGRSSACTCAAATGARTRRRCCAGPYHPLTTLLRADARRSAGARVRDAARRRFRSGRRQIDRSRRRQPPRSHESSRRRRSSIAWPRCFSTSRRTGCF